MEEDNAKVYYISSDCTTIYKDDYTPTIGDYRVAIVTEDCVSKTYMSIIGKDGPTQCTNVDIITNVDKEKAKLLFAGLQSILLAVREELE